MTFSSQELVMERAADPGTVLDISVRHNSDLRDSHEYILKQVWAWVNILPKNPYLAKRGVLEKLILLKSKKDDFREN